MAQDRNTMTASRKPNPIPEVTDNDRPERCPGPPENSHPLLWLDEFRAICENNEHIGIVWELVYDRPLHKYRLRAVFNPTAYALAQLVVTLRGEHSGV